MPSLSAVVIGTDGNVDYVETPDGVRYALGAISVLTLVNKLVASRNRRQALETFNQQGQALVSLDTEAMFELLAPKITRWASTFPLIPQTDQDDSLRGKQMDKAAFEKKLAYLEHQVALLNRGADPRALRNLKAAILSGSVSLPNFGDQTKNDAFYGLGEPKVDTMEDPGAWNPPANVTHPMGKSASALRINTKLAEEIIEQASETEEKIDKLVTAGRKFNAAKAKADIHGVVASLTNMLRDTDLSEVAVSTDIQKLASRMEELHGYFASARV